MKTFEHLGFQPVHEVKLTSSEAKKLDIAARLNVQPEAVGVRQLSALRIGFPVVRIAAQQHVLTGFVLRHRERSEYCALTLRRSGGADRELVEKAGEKDQLFGSVTAKDIAEALASQKYEIDRRKIQLEDPIKQLGEYKVPIRLHRDVTASIQVEVVPMGVERLEEPEAAAAEAEAEK